MEPKWAEINNWNSHLSSTKNHYISTIHNVLLGDPTSEFRIRDMFYFITLQQGIDADSANREATNPFSYAFTRNPRIEHQLRYQCQVFVQDGMTPLPCIINHTSSSISLSRSPALIATTWHNQLRFVELNVLKVQHTRVLRYTRRTSG